MYKRIKNYVVEIEDNFLKVNNVFGTSYDLIYIIRGYNFWIV